MNDNTTNIIRTVVVFLPFFARLYTQNVNASGNNLGIILSNTSSCNGITLCSKVIVIEVVSLTTVAIKKPTTVAPSIFAEIVILSINPPSVAVSKN